MSKTISFHNGTEWSRGHNIRDKRYTDRQEHIDKTLSAQNVVLRDVPVRQAYDDIFGEAVTEYNARQTRADRKIDSYYDKIKQDKRKHTVYECIVQIGDHRDTGADAEPEKQALIRFAREWDRRNPNLRLIGAYIHCDESDGTVHMHMDYIPVATCPRGMKLQNSYDRALQQQGFSSENIHQTAQIAWQDREREALYAICRDMHIDAEINQNISKGRKHLTTTEYKRAKNDMQTEIKQELRPLKEELDKYRDLDVSAKAVVVEKKKIPLTKKAIVPINDMERLEEQAKSYAVNRDEVDTLRTRETALDEREQELNQREQNLNRLRKDLSEKNQRVARMYDEQSHLNQLFEESKRKIAVLEDNNARLKRENRSLSAEIDKRGEIISQLEERFKNAFKSILEGITAIVKAVRTLKADKNLTEEQERLIDAVTDCGIKRVPKNRPELIETMKKAEINQEIQDYIDDLTPRYYRGRSR